MRHQTSKKRFKNRGSILVDVVLGMFFFLVFALTFAALYPVIKRAEVLSSQQSKAVQMTSRLLEHVQMLPATDINSTSLTALNLIEPGQTSQPWEFSKIPMDQASQYSPDQVLKNANGTMTTAVLSGGSVKVSVNLSYTSATGKLQTVKAYTVVGSFR